MQRKNVKQKINTHHTHNTHTQHTHKDTHSHAHACTRAHTYTHARHTHTCRRVLVTYCEACEAGSHHPSATISPFKLILGVDVALLL